MEEVAMSRVKYHRASSILLAFCFSLFSFAEDAPLAHNPAPQPSDEAALRALVEKFFAAYSKKDLAGVLELWSGKSPGITTQEKSAQQQFATEDLSFGSPVISRIKVEGEKADLRVTVALTAINLKSKQKREERLVHNFAFVKEGGEWKVWRYAPAEGDLAEALARTNREAERTTLLEEEKELLMVGLVRALTSKGNRFFSQGDYQQALDVYRLAHSIADQIGDQDGIARVLNNIGIIHYRQGEYAQALERYQQSLAMSKSLEDQAGIARALINIGTVHSEQGNYAQALMHYQKSLAMKGALGEKAEIYVLHNVGNIYSEQGNYAQALEYYRKTLAISEALDDKAAKATALNNIGVVHYRQGSYSQALEYYQKSWAVKRAQEDRGGMASALGNIGNVHRKQGNYAQALMHYEQSLTMSESLGDNAGKARALYNIGDVYRIQGRYAQALEFAERAADLARQIGLSEALWQARLMAGVAYRALNQPDQARLALEESIATVETLRAQVAGGEQEQQRFFEDKVSPYHAMVELLITQKNMAEALAYAERARARVLLDVLHSGRINITKAMTSQEQEQELKLNNLLISLNAQLYRENLRPQPDSARQAELKSQLQKARLDFEAFQTNLYAVHPELKTQRGEAQPLKIEEASALLPDAKTALLEFVVADEKTYLFVLTKQGEDKQATAAVKVYPLEIEQNDLTDRVERFRRMISTQDIRFVKPARELYDLLLRPAADQLRGKTRLVIVPDGPLWELPFQALRTPQDRYLIEDHTVFYVPSLTVLREMINSRSKEAKPFVAPTLLALGNPALGKETVARVKAVMMGERLDPLPEAERQVQALERIFGPGRSKICVGAEAREERFKSEAGSYRILHLATHGILDDCSPMYSHLLLAQNEEGGKEDGQLEAWELMKMDLKADLAVLSACETARGRVGKGEGMIGLTWALFVSGVPTTVVSQWKVRSDSTAELMVEFHRQFKAGLEGSSTRTSAAEALREAALRLMQDGKKYRHPFHWAGFVVVGGGY
jgi:CHAT domain-containing protein/Tfp pilus assembly protein PilF